jgi:hypothetical protein
MPEFSESDVRFKTEAGIKEKLVITQQELKHASHRNKEENCRAIEYIDLSD